MKGRSDALLDSALLGATGKKPSDVLTLAAAAREAFGSALDGQEFVVHVALLRLVKKGWIAVLGGARSGLALYAKPEQAANASPEPLRPHAAGEDEDALAVARAVRDPATRARVAADVAAHRATLAAEHRESAFGSPRTARALLRRVDRGQRTVVVSTGAGDSLRRFLVHEGPWILTAVALFLGVKFLLADVYVIPSPSMVPTLIEGDRVVATRRWGEWMPERWQVVTFRHPGVEGPRTVYVKRVVGLPGEKIAIWQGDVYANGEILVKPDDLSAALRRRIRDWTADGAGLPGWNYETEEDGVRAWTPPPGVLVRPTAADSEPIDLYLELDVEIPEQGMAVLHFHRFADANPARAPDMSWNLEAGRLGARLTETSKGVRPVAPKLLFEDKSPLRGRFTLALAVVDGEVRAAVGGRAWRGKVGMPPNERAGFGFTTVGEGTRALALRLDQDLHYSNRGALAVPGVNRSRSGSEYAHEIPADAVFLLGDNTHNSGDSREPHMGDIRLGKLIGPVVFRLWPPSRIGMVR